MCIHEQSLSCGASQSAVRRCWWSLCTVYRHIHNDQASRSASSWQCACPFYSSRVGVSGKASYHPGMSAPQQPRFGSLRLLVFSKAKIAIEREEICECDSHTVHKLSQRHRTADWLARWYSDCVQTNSKVSSNWLPSYIKATQPVLEILKMDGYFPDSPLFGWSVLFWALFFIKNDIQLEVCMNLA